MGCLNFLYSYLLDFVETDSRLPLTSAHISTLIAITGTEESDQWAGHQAALHNEPTVEFEGRCVGGMRIRPLYAAEAVPEESFSPRVSWPRS
jgi:hypothetical protein